MEFKVNLVRELRENYKLTFDEIGEQLGNKRSTIISHYYKNEHAKTVNN